MQAGFAVPRSSLASSPMDASAELVRPVEVRASGRYRIWIRFADDVAGDVDLSDLGGHGVFAALAEVIAGAVPQTYST